jgi:hypothetical protein
MKRGLLAAFVVMLSLCACATAQQTTSVEERSVVADEQQAGIRESATYASDDGSLWVKIVSPQDGDTFAESEIVVNGQAPLDTVLSIGDGIVYLDKSTDFYYPISLQEGANLIEIVASNSAGVEVDIILTVYLEP